MLDFSRRLNYRTIIALRYGLFLLVAAPVFAVAFQDVALRWRHRSVEQEDIENIFQLQDQGKKLPPKYLNLWKRIEPTCRAFERIALDLEYRMEKNQRYFDRLYVEGLIANLQESIAREPKLALYLLGHYALDGASPLTQTLALITIRQRYPKKFSVYFANRFVNSDQPILARLCRQIISGRYQVTNLTSKLNPKFIATLQNP